MISMSTPVTQSCCLYTQSLLKPFRKNAFIFGFLQQEYMTASDSLLTSMNLNACGFNAYTVHSLKKKHPLELPTGHIPEIQLKQIPWTNL